MDGFLPIASEILAPAPASLIDPLRPMTWRSWARRKGWELGSNPLRDVLTDHGCEECRRPSGHMLWTVFDGWGDHKDVCGDCAGELAESGWRAE